MADTATGAPTLFPTLLYRDAKAAIRQLTEGFGFTRDALYESEDGTVLHAELSYGNGTVMLGSKGHGGVYGEAMRDAGPAGVYVVVQDPDAHHKRAEQAGVEILTPPTDQEYGSRDYTARDAEGNLWTFGTYTPGATLS
ncbi:VOC family protein [Streptomyces sp. MST-110588]|uniref:VOC family protein n=1 Tax=Streptomyces sp. MST-110588 TaxID=2833628 RepID=UPI001F5CACBB|nr:VOC family protein [Streptomyces sp. MST-110588]UNO42780.1 VOC family protein [Streptomyces sp. MST-110588]